MHKLNFHRFDAYKKSKWSGEGDDVTCTDPALLFDSVSLVLSHSDLFSEIKIKYSESNVADEVMKGDNLTKVLSVVDMEHYGRCFTLEPGGERASRGISQIHIKATEGLTILYHTPGM